MKLSLLLPQFKFNKQGIEVKPNKLSLGPGGSGNQLRERCCLSGRLRTASVQSEGWRTVPKGTVSSVTVPLEKGASSMQTCSYPGVWFLLSESLAQWNQREQPLGRAEKSKLAVPRLR